MISLCSPACEPAGVFRKGHRKYDKAGSYTYKAKKELACRRT